jgi:hypothetical protein
MRGTVAKRLRKQLWADVLASFSTREINRKIGTFGYDFRRLKKEYRWQNRTTDLSKVDPGRARLKRRMRRRLLAESSP